MELKTITIQIKTFAVLRQVIGEPIIHISIYTGASLLDLINLLSINYGHSVAEILFPNGSLATSYNYLVNQKPVDPSEEGLANYYLNDSDVVLIIPLVGGG